MSLAWRELFEDPRGERHLVQIYREGGFLARAVAAWLGPALRAGGGALLACSEENARAVRDQLAQDGVDVDDAGRSGRFVVLDADRFLARFMRDGAPVASLFKPIARAEIVRVRARSAPGADVRVWGEMVDILAKEGNSVAAQRLEAVWNEVIDEEGIRLLCSYELDPFSADAHAGPLPAVCAGHSQLIPAEDYAALGHAVDSALVEVFGESEAPHVRASLAGRRTLPLGMPASASVLIGLQRADPMRGAQVLRATRRILDAGSPA